MMASNAQKYEQDSKRDEENTPSIADMVIKMINQMSQGGKKAIETQTAMSTRIKEKVTRESTNSRIKDKINRINKIKIQKEKEMYCSLAKDEAYSKITEQNLFAKSCIDPTGDDLKIASGAFGYWIDMYAGEYDEIKEECVVEYDTCKKDGMPYIYEAYCDSKTGLPAQMQPAQMLDCREIFGDEDYVCIKGACILKICGDGLVNLIGEECDDGNNLNGDGCDKECKNEPLLPDLVIGKINENVVSEACVNFFEFEICNQGNADVKDNFKIAVYANSEKSVFTYDAEEQPINMGECVLVKNPTKTNILKFGTLGESHEVSIVLDTGNDIEETSDSTEEDAVGAGGEDNNEKSQTVYFGDNYYYTPNDFSEENICNTWCFDTDDGKNYWKSGDINWIYTSQAYNDKDQCNKYGDFDNQVYLYEQYCISPIYKLDNGLYVYPQGEKVIDCTLLDAKCKDGKCVLIENNYLNCQDKEGMKSIFTYGEVDYTSIDGEKMKLKDVCKNEEYLLEYYCKNDELAESDVLSCFYENAVCKDGKCVKTDKTNEFEDSDPDNDPFVYGTGLFIKLNGETEEYNDDCLWKNYEVQQFSAGKNNYPEASTTDCTQYQNENGAAMCANGVCTYPDPSLMVCEDGGDNGLNFYEYGVTHSVNAYNLEDYNDDFCIKDSKNENSNLLVEFYCNGDELKMTEPYDCSSEGMACYDGRCVVVDESLKSCDMFEKKGENVIHYTNEFGDEEQDAEFECSETNEVSSIEAFNWEKESNYLAQFYCNGNEPAYSITDCTVEGKKCYKGECLVEDTSLVKCEDIAVPKVEVAVAIETTETAGETTNQTQSEPQQESQETQPEEDNKNPFVKGITLYTNGFGEEDGYNDYCENEELLSESYCDGNTQQEVLINCADYDMKCYNGKCVMPDESLKSCEIQNEGEEWQVMIYTNEFGYTDYFSNNCIEEEDIEDIPNVGYTPQETDILLNYKCDENNLAYDVINCKEQGKVCYNGKCLVKDESLKSCTNDPIESAPDDPFIEGKNIYTNEFGFEDMSGDNCDKGNYDIVNTMLYETYCEGNELAGKLIDCNDYGMKCNDWKDICQQPVTEMKCEDTDDGKDPNVPGKVTFTSEFGDTESEFDHCKWDSKVGELYCMALTPEGEKIYPEYDIITCEEGKTCREFCDAEGNYIGDACADTNDQTNMCKSESTAPMEKPASSSGGGGSGPG
ncbi:hypothetical protein HY636_01825 [Candidatus Woesearchaeota archaeon]|nr:hypothetical protein [Candidatus Woesearchaeota archaeon]